MSHPRRMMPLVSARRDLPIQRHDGGPILASSESECLWELDQHIGKQEMITKYANTSLILILLGAQGCGHSPQSAATDPADDASANKVRVAVANDQTPAPPVLLTAGKAASDGKWGTLTGRFVYPGTPPKAEKLNVSKEPLCSPHNLVNETLLVDPDGGLADVIVYLYIKRSGKVSAIHPDYQEDATDAVVLDNKNCRFEPHSVLLRTTQTLVVKNSDPFGHNSNVTQLAGLDIVNENPTVPAGSEVELKFEKRSTLPGPVVCNIHPWMSARLYVADHPYMAASAKDGKFEIQNLPVGDHEFVFSHELGYLKNATYTGGKTSKKGRAKIKIKEGKNDIGEVKVDPKVLKKK